MRSRLMREPIWAAALLLLGGCNRQEPGPAAMSEEEVASQLAKVKVEPGQWESTTEIISASGGLPQEQLRQMTGRRTSTSNCITPAQAARPSANFIAAQQDSDCGYQQFRMEAGKISGRMTCSGGQGETTTVMSGDYGPRSYDMRVQVETPGLPGAEPVTVVTRTRGRRVGACG